MNPIKIGLVAAILVAGILLALLAHGQAQADEPKPGCYALDLFRKDLVENKVPILSEAAYDGVNSDLTLIIGGKKEILAVGFKQGCMVGMTGVDLVAVHPGQPA